MNNNRREVVSLSPEETEQTAREFARAVLLQPDAVAVVLLYGEVGAGKSVFARAVLRECGVVVDTIPSPTFSLVNEYLLKVAPDRCSTGARYAYHVDLYRVQTESELYALDLPSCAADGIELVEWAQRFSVEQ